MSEVISLDASPIVQTTVRDVELLSDDVDSMDVTKLSDVQAQEYIVRLSENIRFMVDENKKLVASNRALSNERVELVTRLLASEREFCSIKDLLDKADVVVKEAEKLIAASGDIDEKIEALETAEKMYAAPETEPFVGDEVIKFNQMAADYQIEAMKFSNFYDSQNGHVHGSKDHIMNAAVGMAEEAGEVLAALERDGGTIEERRNEFQDELGDLQWYICMMCDARCISLSAVVELAVTRIDPDPNKLAANSVSLIRATLSLLGNCKKVVYHGHQIPQDSWFSELVHIQSLLVSSAMAAGWNLEKIMGSNLNKLNTRFPEKKFSQARSINRDK